MTFTIKKILYNGHLRMIHNDKSHGKYIFVDRHIIKVNEIRQKSNGRPKRIFDNITRDKILRLIDRNLTVRQIANKINIPKSTIGDFLKKADECLNDIALQSSSDTK